MGSSAVAVISLLRQHAAILPKFYNCGFNQQLYQGTLPKSVFRRYLEQDIEFLQASAQAHELIGARSSDQAHARFFYDCARDIIQLEKDIHANYLKKLAPNSFFSPAEPKQKMSAISEYARQLLSNAKHRPLEEAVASLIPCPWIYMELGHHMDLSTCTAAHPYRDWIATYQEKQFIESTHQLIGIADELISSTRCPQKQQSITEQFRQSVEFEYRFFEEIIQPTSSIPIELDARLLYRV